MSVNLACQIPESQTTFAANTWIMSNRILDKFTIGIPNTTMQQKPTQSFTG
jgi:hypothetical protein